MKLLLNAMWPPEIADQLRHRGHDVVAVVERPELRDAADEVIFSAAMAEGRAILTEDAAGFRILAAEELAQGRSHPGLILTSNRRFPRSDPRTVGRLVTALDELLSGGLDLAGQEYWLS